MLLLYKLRSGALPIDDFFEIEKQCFSDLIVYFNGFSLYILILFIIIVFWLTLICLFFYLLFM